MNSVTVIDVNPASAEYQRAPKNQNCRMSLCWERQRKPSALLPIRDVWDCMPTQ